MRINVTKEVAQLGKLGTADLRARYAEVFGEPTRSGNRPWLVKRIAWRLQALAAGGLSERARQRAEELARDADLRLRPPAEGAARSAPAAPLPQARSPSRPTNAFPPPARY
jgi:hypothetical protein